MTEGDHTAEAFSLPPSSMAQRYGTRAEELELAIRAAGLVVSYDMPGEGFTLSRGDSTNWELVEWSSLPVPLQLVVNELEELTTS